MSFHAVPFGLDGHDGNSTYLRRMVQIAQDAQNNAPRDPLASSAETILSSYTEALDTVRLHDSGYLDGCLPTFICTTLGPTRQDIH